MILLLSGSHLFKPVTNKGVADMTDINSPFVSLCGLELGQKIPCAPYTGKETVGCLFCSRFTKPHQTTLF